MNRGADLMTWSIVCEKDAENELLRLFVMGPAVHSMITEDALAMILANPEVARAWKPKLSQYLRELPTVPVTDFFNHTLMLHYAVLPMSVYPDIAADLLAVFEADLHYPAFSGRRYSVDSDIWIVIEPFSVIDLCICRIRLIHYREAPFYLSVYLDNSAGASFDVSFYNCTRRIGIAPLSWVS